MPKNIDIFINVRTTKFNKGITKANTKLDTLNKTTGRILRTMSAFAALFVARAFARGMVDTVKAAGDLQLQMIQIGRVSGIAGAALQGMKKDLLDLSTSIVAGVDELAELAVVAGRAGINTREGMIMIARAASMMANVTDLSAVEATNALIKISKAMRLPINEAQNLGSVIVGVAKDFAASESEIVQAMLRMVGSGKLLGATAPELTVLSAMTIELGLNARRAGMVWNRSFFQMGKNLEKAAAVMGVSSAKLTLMIEKDFIGTITELLKKIAEIPTKVARLEKVREIFQLVGARGVALLVDRVDELSEAISKANSQFDEGTELTKDYEKVLIAFNSQAKLLGDTFSRLKIAIGEDALPTITKQVKILQKSLLGLAISIEEVGLAQTILNRILVDPFLSIGKDFENFLRSLKEIGKKPLGDTEELSFLDFEDFSENANRMRNLFDEVITEMSENRISTEEETTEALREIEEQRMLDISSKAIQSELAKIEKLRAMWQAWQDENKSIILAGNQAELEQFKFKIETMKKANASLWSIAGKLRDTFSSGVSQMFVDMIKGTFDAKTAFKQLGIQMVQILIEFAVRKAINFAIAQAFKASEIGALQVFGAAAAQALAPAAAFMSIITAGGAAVAGNIALAASVAFAKGLGALGMKEGGIVPGVGRGDRVPALLEPGETVIPRNQVSNFFNNARPTVNVSLEGAFILDDPSQVEKLWREHLRDFFREEVRNRRDVFV